MQFRKGVKGIPILSKQNLEDYAIEFLEGFSKDLLRKAQPIPIEEISEMHLKLELDYQKLKLDKSILGLTCFTDGYLDVYNDESDLETIYVKKNTVIIDNELAEDKSMEGRFRFTCSHETSHWLLHRHMYEKDENQICMFDNSEAQVISCLNRNIENIFCYYDFKADDDWIEWQADYLGGAILMPKTSIRQTFAELLDKMHIHQNYIFLDNQVCNITNYRNVVNQLAYKFNVSKKAVQVRLDKLGLVKRDNGQLSFL